MNTDHEGRVPIDDFLFLDAARQGASALANSELLAGRILTSYKWGSVHDSLIGQLTLLRLKSLYGKSEQE